MSRWLFSARTDLTFGEMLKFFKRSRIAYIIMALLLLPFPGIGTLWRIILLLKVITPTVFLFFIRAWTFHIGSWKLYVLLSSFREFSFSFVCTFLFLSTFVYCFLVVWSFFFLIYFSYLVALSCKKYIRSGFNCVFQLSHIP